MFKKYLPLMSYILSGHFIIGSSMVYAHQHQSDPSHYHSLTAEHTKRVTKDSFIDSDVKDRKLSDWKGNWQSVYGYLMKGDLDNVLKTKAAMLDIQSFAQYKDYYTKGYATDIDLITIEDDQIIFFKESSVNSCRYKYQGYKILTYQSGKRGVRYLFECTQANSQVPKYVQFSDHLIQPTPSPHFHIYMGNDSQAALLKELDNWPTYYPLSLSKDEIVHEMLEH